VLLSGQNPDVGAPLHGRKISAKKRRRGDPSRPDVGELGRLSEGRASSSPVCINTEKGDSPEQKA